MEQHPFERFFYITDCSFLFGVNGFIKVGSTNGAESLPDEQLKPG